MYAETYKTRRIAVEILSDIDNSPISLREIEKIVSSLIQSGVKESKIKKIATKKIKERSKPANKPEPDEILVYDIPDKFEKTIKNPR